MQGRGTFAAVPKMAQPLQLTSYTEDMRRRGLASRSQLLSVGYVAADEELAWRLDVRPRARILRIERLRIASEEPMAIETTHLVSARFPGLSRRLGGSVSLYELLATEYGVVLVEAEETIETVPAPPKEAELLNTTVGYPMLLLSRHSRDSSGRPVEYARSFYRGDRYKFVAHLQRPERPAAAIGNDGTGTGGAAACWCEIRSPRPAKQLAEEECRRSCSHRGPKRWMGENKGRINRSILGGQFREPLKKEIIARLKSGA